MDRVFLCSVILATKFRPRVALENRGLQFVWANQRVGSRGNSATIGALPSNSVFGTYLCHRFLKQAGFAFFGLSLSFNSGLIADEGMFPLSELAKLDLKSAGIELSPEQIFNPAGISVVDGICRVNGCTGSFLSADGLIITNHHCAFDAIQKASTSQNDYLKNGFVSKGRGDEIPAPDTPFESLNPIGMSRKKF